MLKRHQKVVMKEQVVVVVVVFLSSLPQNLNLNLNHVIGKIITLVI